MRKPSALFYLFGVLAIGGAAAFFVRAVHAERARVTDAIAGFDRFVGPGSGLFEESPAANPNRGAAILEFKTAGQYSVCYESYGVLREHAGDAGEVFDTPVRQLWPTKNRISMELTVARDDGADTGEKVAVRPAGFEADKEEQERIEKNPRTATPKNRGLIVYNREVHGRTGHAVWQVEIPAPGFYRFETRYVPGVDKDPASVVVPPLFTKEERKSQRIPTPQVQAREKERREAEEDRELARVKRIPVLFAVGQDPLGQRLFDPAGFYGKAGLCAFIFTLSLAGMVLVWAMRSRKDVD